MQHPLRHGPTVYNGHLRGPVTLTPDAAPWQWSFFPQLVLRLRSVATGDRTPISRMRGEHSLHATAAVDQTRRNMYNSRKTIFQMLKDI